MRSDALKRGADALHHATLVDKSDLDTCVMATVSAALDPEDPELRKLVRIAMNAECPPGLGITDRGAALALAVLSEFFAPPNGPTKADAAQSNGPASAQAAENTEDKE